MILPVAFGPDKLKMEDSEELAAKVINEFNSILNLKDKGLNEYVLKTIMKLTPDAAKLVIHQFEKAGWGFVGLTCNFITGECILKLRIDQLPNSLV